MVQRFPLNIPFEKLTVDRFRVISNIQPHITAVETPYRITGLPSATTYFLEVTALNEYGESEKSHEVEIFFEGTPQLYQMSAEIIPGKTNVMAGENVSIKVSVKNTTSNESVKDAFVQLYISGLPGGNTSIGAGITNSQGIFERSYTIPANIEEDTTGYIGAIVSCRGFENTVVRYALNISGGGSKDDSQGEQNSPAFQTAYLIIMSSVLVVFLAIVRRALKK